MAETYLVLALVILVSVGTLQLFGGNLNTAFVDIGNRIANPTELSAGISSGGLTDVTGSDGLDGPSNSTTNGPSITKAKTSP